MRPKASSASGFIFFLFQPAAGQFARSFGGNQPRCDGGCQLSVWLGILLLASRFLRDFFLSWFLFSLDLVAIIAQYVIPTSPTRIAPALSSASACDTFSIHPRPRPRL